MSFFFLLFFFSYSSINFNEAGGREGLSTICVKIELLRNSHVRPVSGIDDTEAVGFVGRVEDFFNLFNFEIFDLVESDYRSL